MRIYAEVVKEIKQSAKIIGPIFIKSLYFSIYSLQNTYIYGGKFVLLINIKEMKSIMNIFLVVQPPAAQNNMPMEMNSNTWFVIGLVVAILLLIYLIIAMVKPEKF